MPAIDLVVSTEVSQSIRARQVSAMFDVPAQERSELRWRGELPIEADDWNVGLIVGPSGSGKSTIAKHVFGEHVELPWGAKSVIDDFDARLSVEQIADVCSAVGFNTIPAWLRPYHVLSNGERFRVDLARRLLELPDPIVVDEFTSVVDRQVAQVGSHAVQKFVRRHNRKFVAVSCHYDIIDWLQPDWVLEVATMSFTRRRLQRRPSIECTIGRVPRAAWGIFAPYHYLTADMHSGARCFGLWANGRLAAFSATLPFPGVRGLLRLSRTVTLPDWQGLGLGHVLTDALGAAYKATGRRVRSYPSHPAYIRARDRSPHWRLCVPPGNFRPKKRNSFTTYARPCAVFEYCGPAMPLEQAESLLAGA